MRANQCQLGVLCFFTVLFFFGCCKDVKCEDPTTTSMPTAEMHIKNNSESENLSDEISNLITHVDTKSLSGNIQLTTLEIITETPTHQESTELYSTVDGYDGIFIKTLENEISREFTTENSLKDIEQSTTLSSTESGNFFTEAFTITVGNEEYTYSTQTGEKSSITTQNFYESAATTNSYNLDTTQPKLFEKLQTTTDALNINQQTTESSNQDTTIEIQPKTETASTIEEFTKYYDTTSITTENAKESSISINKENLKTSDMFAKTMEGIYGSDNNETYFEQFLQELDSEITTQATQTPAIFTNEEDKLSKNNKPESVFTSNDNFAPNLGLSAETNPQKEPTDVNKSHFKMMDGPNTTSVLNEANKVSTEAPNQFYSMEGTTTDSNIISEVNFITEINLVEFINGERVTTKINSLIDYDIPMSEIDFSKMEPVVMDLKKLPETTEQTTTVLDEDLSNILSLDTDFIEKVTENILSNEKMQSFKEDDFTSIAKESTEPSEITFKNTDSTFNLQRTTPEIENLVDIFKDITTEKPLETTLLTTIENEITSTTLLTNTNRLPKTLETTVKTITTIEEIKTTQPEQDIFQNNAFEIEECTTDCDEDGSNNSFNNPTTTEIQKEVLTLQDSNDSENEVLTRSGDGIYVEEVTELTTSKLKTPTESNSVKVSEEKENISTEKWIPLNENSSSEEKNLVESEESIEEIGQTQDIDDIFDTLKNQFENSQNKEIGTEKNSLKKLDSETSGNSLEEETKKQVDMDNDNEQILSGRIFNKLRSFSVKITENESSYFIPSSATILQSNAHFINITWCANNNEHFLSLNFTSEEKSYKISSICLQQTKEEGIVEYRKNVEIAPLEVEYNKSESMSQRIKLNDDLEIVISNIDFLIKEKANESTTEIIAENSRVLKSATLTVEIIGGVVALTVLLGICAFYAFKKLKGVKNHFKPNLV